jgi:RNA polymerase sigma factor (sigma-70 family)
MKPAALRHPAHLAGASLLRLQSDARLAELAVAGHESAFDAIVDRYRTPLMRYCAGIVGPSRAEDAVQQTLINAHEAMTRTDEVRHLKSWLYRIAHNAALNVLRAVKDDVPLDEAALGARAGDAADHGPVESFERSEQFRETLAALQALPERQRAALVLRELEGRSHEEIAAALGVTKGSARQHLMRGRAAVRSAVTAVTPYPLVARMAEMLSGGGNAGWVDAAAGAGASATLMKLGAGVAATGALVGGAVGTQHALRDGPSETTTVSHAAERAGPKPTATVASAAPTAVRRASAPTPAVRRASAPVERSSSKPGPPPHKRRARAASPTPGRAAPAAASTPSVPSAKPVKTHRGSDEHANPSSGRGHSQDKGRQGAKKPKKPKNNAKAKPKKSPSPTSKGSEKGKGQGKGNSNSNSNSNGNGNGQDKTQVKGKGKDKAEDQGQPPAPAPAANAPSSPGSKGSGSDASKGKPDKSVPKPPSASTPAPAPTVAFGDDD